MKSVAGLSFTATGVLLASLSLQISVVGLDYQGKK